MVMRPVRSVGSAVVAVAIAFGLLALLFPQGGGAATYASASAAIAVSAAIGGLRPGLLATILSAAVVATVHLPPAASLHIDHPEEVLGLLVFVANGLVVAATASTVRERRREPSSGIAASVPDLEGTVASPATASARVVVPPVVVAPTAATTPGLVETLTVREVEVLSLVAAGCSNGAIAESLFVSINTVKTHLKSVYGKLGVASRTQAIRRAVELGVLPAPVASRAERDERGAA